MMTKEDEVAEKDATISRLSAELEEVRRRWCNSQSEAADWYAAAITNGSSLSEAREAISRLSAKLAALTLEASEALEPFARFAAKAEAFVQSRVGAANDDSGIMAPTKDFRLGDFIRARDVLAKLSAKGA
jgi:hypothetical protein